MTINEAKERLIKYCGKDGEKVIAECAKTTPFDGSFGDFSKNYCATYDGNWNRVLLTGIKKLFPNVYEVIPNNTRHHFDWICLISVLILCGVGRRK